MRILLVEDDLQCRAMVEGLLRRAGAEVRAAGTVQDALAALADPPDLVLLDVQLPDGSGLQVAEAANRLRPPPCLIAATGQSHPAVSFRLARLNVQHYLPKPYDLEDIRAALAQVRSVDEELTAAGARAVGRLGLVEARELLRGSMVDEALQLADGNRTAAARMLGVTRQAIQSAVRE